MTRSPVTELGQAGARLAERVRKTFAEMPRAEVAGLIAALGDAALARRVVYVRDDVVEPIRVFPRPLTALPEQLSYARYASFSLAYALKRLPQLYLRDPAVRAILQLPEEEEAWLQECWTPQHREVNPVFGRLDAVMNFASPGWRESLRFIEPNLSGIGGLHLGPTVDRMVARVVGPALEARGVHLAVSIDLRELLMQELIDHLELCGRHGDNVCFVEPKYAGDGPDEQEEIARYLRRRHGLRVMHADPAELSIVGDEVVYDGTVVDVAYRDYAVRDLLELRAEGVDVEPMRRLLRENRVVSSFAGELDQKSGWEVLTDPVLAARHFSAEERLVFRRHVAWTRLVADRRTTLSDGREGELLEVVRREREGLVLKPNRGYGGAGIVVGASVTPAAWEAALQLALTDPDDRWVVQERVEVPRVELPVLVDS